MRITRRIFIKGAALALLTMEAPGMSGAAEADNLVEKTMPLMGTTARISIVDPNRDRARQAMAQAFARIRTVDRLMSVFREESEISLLNRYGYHGGLSPETAFVLAKAEHYAKLSNGAFDISVLPALESKGERGSRPRVNHKNISLNGRNVRFLKKDIRVTLGGIGIGYAVDVAAETLQKFNIRHAMINEGGDIRTIGRKDDGVSWRVGIEDPGRSGDIVAVIDLDDRAVATSGNYRRRHIMDPQTGAYPEELLSATIIAPSAIDADAVSTTVFVKGLEKGMELINSIDGVEGLLITDNHGILKSKGFKDFEI